MDFNPPLYLCDSAASFQGFSQDSNLLGMSLQDMIDSDIKAEFDDISCGNTSGNFGNVDSLDLLDFKFDEDMLTSSCNLGSFGASLSNTNSSMFGHSYMEDSGGATSVMVNPISVMPVSQQHHSQQQQQQLHHQGLSNVRLSINTQFGNEVGSTFSLGSPSVIVKQSQLKGFGPSSGPSPIVHRTIKIMPPVSSPLQQVPSPSASLGGPLTPNPSSQSTKKKVQSGHQGLESGFPKPAYSYSCLIALALKNSRTGALSVSEIYKFMCEHFPYFRTAPSGWKNSVRHNLSLNKCFEKIEKPTTNGNQRKGCLWAMNPAKITKMDEEVAKWSRKDPAGIKKGMVKPETLELLERGELVKDYNANMTGVDSEDEDDPRTPTSVSSQEGQGMDFVDVEAFTVIPDCALPELNLQASGEIFEGLDSGNTHVYHGNYAITSVLPSGSMKPYNTVVLHQ